MVFGGQMVFFRVVGHGDPPHQPTAVDFFYHFVAISNAIINSYTYSVIAITLSSVKSCMA